MRTCIHGVLLAVGLAATRGDDAPRPPPTALRACGGVGGAYAGAWLAPAAHVAAVDWLPADPKLAPSSFRAFRGRCVLKPQPPESFWVDHLSQYERNVAREARAAARRLSIIHISEPTRPY